MLKVLHVLSPLTYALHKKWSSPLRTFLSKHEQISSFLQICSHVLAELLMEVERTLMAVLYHVWNQV